MDRGRAGEAEESKQELTYRPARTRRPGLHQMGRAKHGMRREPNPTYTTKANRPNLRYWS
jgi:hypothetical protein